MSDRDKRNSSILAFEDVPGRADIQVSKVFKTVRGDGIRAIVTTGNTVVLTGVGQASNSTVIVSGEKGADLTDSVMYAGFWDYIAELGKKIGVDILSDGQKCQTIKATIDVTVDGKATKATVEVTTCTST